MKIIEFDDLKKLRELGILQKDEIASLSSDSQRLVVSNPMLNTTRYVETRHIPFRLKSQREYLCD